MAPINNTVSEVQRSARLIDESARGARVDYMGAWQTAKSRANTAELRLPNEAYGLIMVRMLSKARGYMAIHCGPDQITQALNDALIFSETEGVALPETTFRETMYKALSSVAATLPYLRDQKSFKYASVRAQVAFQISQDAKIALRPADGEAFVNACNKQAASRYVKKDAAGASAAQALADQTATWLAASRNGRVIDFRTEAFPVLKPYRATWRERLFDLNIESQHLVMLGIAATGVALVVHRTRALYK